MNSLSWFLYWTGVLGSMSVFFGVTGTLALILALLMLLSLAISGGDAECWKPFWPTFKKFLVYGLCTTFVGAFLPSKQTMYAIAASQVGEQVIKSEAVQGVASDATKALQIWIKKQIEPSTPSK